LTRAPPKSLAVGCTFYMIQTVCSLGYSLIWTYRAAAGLVLRCIITGTY
jgi:hypothetical protein